MLSQCPYTMLSEHFGNSPPVEIKDGFYSLINDRQYKSSSCGSPPGVPIATENNPMLFLTRRMVYVAVRFPCIFPLVPPQGDHAKATRKISVLRLHMMPPAEFQFSQIVRSVTASRYECINQSSRLGDYPTSLHELLTTVVLLLEGRFPLRNH